MKQLYELKEKLSDELKELSRKPDLGVGDLDLIHKLTDTIKNIDKICMLEEQGYSEDGYGGRSYANRGEHWVRGHYSRDGGQGGSGGGQSYDGYGQDGDGGYSGRRGGRDSRGRYSRDGGRSEMMEHLDAAVRTANEQDRETIRRFMEKLEQM